ncbi:sulfite exporter TauE/SafE family protein [soil metagenome]
MIAILAAGLAAGTINTVVGSGTLISFPVLLAFGYSPLTANVSNTIGLAPGALSGAYGYREELKGQRRRIIVYGIAALLGGAVGAILLLSLPSDVFDSIVPAFVILAVIRLVVQPTLAAKLADRPRGRGHAIVGRVACFLTGIYGGYFGAAQGVMLLAVLGITDPDDLQRTNALKNLLAGSVNGLAGVIFAFGASIAWTPAILLAVGSIAGGQVGAKIGRSLSPQFLRGLIVVVGTIAAVHLIVD